ncbi:ClpX C4-type zinc finger protein [Microlunatus sp. GCM10028923]|uniref:ClpX C4-type zinc finger protein n=1 Tax=Microlunatus sp. GCM10028923 TaxID=3273400 RepID=UPI00361F629C
MVRRRERDAERVERRCSFCGKGDGEVDRLVAGPGAYICNDCVGLAEQLLAKEGVASFITVDESTDEELLARMVRLDGSREQVERAVRDHVRALRERRISWERIGRALGVSRQTAWERFADER